MHVIEVESESFRLKRVEASSMVGKSVTGIVVILLFISDQPEPKTKAYMNHSID